MVVEDFLGERTDEGLPSQRAMKVLFGALEDIGDMEGAFGGQKYVIYDIHIRLTFYAGRGGGARFGPPERAEGAKLSQGCGFKDFEEIGFSDRVHRWCKRFAYAPICGRSRYMSIH
jgi:hypothetical protein